MTSNETNPSESMRNIGGNFSRVNSKMKRTKKPKCKLDSNNCLNLKDILLSFNGPISQEQAWALCYQATKTFLNLSQNEFRTISDPSHILLHKDGSVQMDFDKDSSSSHVSEKDLVFSLGLVIFDALDYGLEEAEERPISPDLNTLISLMTSDNQECRPEEERLQETDDEGIERDSGETELDDLLAQNLNGSYSDEIKLCSLQNVLHMCERHVGNNDQAEAHYQAVIRAFVTEALELSQFLEKVAYEKQRTSFRDPITGDGTKHCDTVCKLNSLDFADWTDIRIWRAIQARFWVQVIGELRRGVKLKKVEDDLGRRNSIRGMAKGAEFELTPYEILMDDIRKRRYHLKKAPEPKPQIRKDARSIILDFIRSRPPLKKASERKLAPLKREATLRELLMESIKKPPKPLKKTRLHHSPIIEMAFENVGGESRRIVLGEVPPARTEQEQEPAQDVAAQWLHDDSQEKNRDSKINALSKPKMPVPQPRSRIGKTEEAKSRGIRNPHAQEASVIEGSKISQRNLASVDSVSRQPRKLIPVDFDLKLDGEEEDDDDDDDDDFEISKFDDDDDDDDEDDEDSTNYWHSKERYACGKGKLTMDLCEDCHDDDDEKDSANPWRKTGKLRLTKNEYHRFCDAQLESYDLATQCPSRRASARKHATRGNSLVLPSFSGTTSLPHSRPHSRQQAGIIGTNTSPSAHSPNVSLNISPRLSPQPRTRPVPKPRGSIDSEINSDTKDWEKEHSEQKPSLNDMFLDDRLSLTLEEIVHIRSVLTKAELESLPVEGRVKEDVEKRRVCFLCLKTRFGILGPWGQRCRLCERTVCVKCYTKMRIPTEHFSHVPVVLLSPGILLSPTTSESDSGKNSWLRASGAVGSAPASPASRRRDSNLRSATPSSPSVTPSAVPTAESTPTSYSKPEHLHSSEKRRFKPTGSPAKLSTTATFGSLGGLSPEQRLIAERLRGVSMVVCHDCRIMVVQIIKSSRNTRATIRNNVISRLTLNLSPAYV
ncbi:protein spire isoform X3 [Leptopilina boulardi]|uniref:protein spire isoform X3 n=1 Tax=Leptopilina boulardi TaxID=63433 RepID=UPI0021F51A8A|nr:protein spire isoform X3 [Leptopilina boulardi]